MTKFKLTMLMLLITAFGVAVSGCVKKPQPAVNVNQPANTNTPTTTAEIDTSDNVDELVTQINNWNLYKLISSRDKKIFDFDSCGDSEFDSLVAKVNSGNVYELKLNGELILIYTPNYYSWTNDQLLSHKSFCQAGAIWPRRAYDDKIFWSGVCSSGYKPDKSDPGYSSFQKCLVAEKAVEIFSKQDQ